MPFWFTWVLILGCQDILMLARSLIIWRQSPDMTIAVDWDAKPKETKKKKKRLICFRN